MDSESPKDKDASISAKGLSSSMSIEESEEPTSPGSNSSGSIFNGSDHDGESEESIREKQLRPQISRASSTNAVGGISLERTWTNKSTTTKSDPAFEIDFDDNDRGNPQNWPTWYKGVVIGVMSYATTCIVLFSTSYTSAIPGLQGAFGITDTVGVLGMTTYMIGRYKPLNSAHSFLTSSGIAIGVVVLAPLSEMYGRRPIYVVSSRSFSPLCSALRFSREHGNDSDHPVLRSILRISFDFQCARIRERHSRRGVSGIGFLNMVDRTNQRTRDWSCCRGLCLPIPWLEMDELGRSHSCRCRLDHGLAR